MKKKKVKTCERERKKKVKLEKNGNILNPLFFFRGNL